MAADLDLVPPSAEDRPGVPSWSRFRPGVDLGVAGPLGMALVATDAPEAFVRAVAAGVLGGADFGALVDVLLTHGARDLPDLACAVWEPGGIRVLVRGDVGATVDDGGRTRTVHAPSVSTWHEELVPLGAVVALTRTTGAVDETDREPGYAVRAGVVPARHLERRPTPVDEPSPGAQDTTGGLRLVTPVAEVVATPPLHTLPPPPVAATPFVPPPPVVPGPFVPPPPVAPTGFAPPPPVAPANHPPPPMAPPAYAPPPPALPPGVVTVEAVHCGQGHPNPTHAQTCRSCRTPINNRAVAAVARPSLGILRFLDGTVVELDTPLVIGRAPASVLSDGAPAKPVVLPTGTGLLDIHLEVQLDGWQVLIVPRDTHGAVQVEAPAQARLRLQPLAPWPIVPGTYVALGDDAAGFVYAVPRS